MTPEPINASAPEAKGLSEASRLTGVFFEPSKTFEDIAARPNFIVPLILIMLCALAYTTLFAQHVGWERMMRHQMELSTRAQQMTPEQREQGIQMQLKFVPVFAYGGVLLGVPLTYAIWAAILFGIVKGIMSAPVKYKQVFAVICYASVTGILFML